MSRREMGVVGDNSLDGLCSLLIKFLFHILTDHEAGQLGLGQSLVKLREHWQFDAFDLDHSRDDS